MRTNHTYFCTECGKEHAKDWAYKPGHDDDRQCAPPVSIIGPWSSRSRTGSPRCGISAPASVGRSSRGRSRRTSVIAPAVAAALTGVEGAR